MKRLLAVILVLCVLCCALTGCDVLLEILKNQMTDSETEPEKLPYTLTQQTVDAFYALLQETESLCITTEDGTAAEEKLEALDAAYLGLIDQYQIAYINYCLDQTDTAQKQVYMACVDITTQAESAYNDMCKRVYLSDTSIRDLLFADWTAEEIDRMLKRNDEVSALEKRNAELTVEYRDLEENEDWAENVAALYNEMVRNNNRIAEIYGYERYYDYAYQVIYDRDYGTQELDCMRRYVGQYLPEAYEAAMDSFSELFEELDRGEQELVAELLYSPYDALDENYAMQYIQAAPETAQTGMQEMFEKNRVIFTDYANSYEGAFTTWIAGEPFCYYGPGYDNSLTLIHELGHYYGTSFVEPWSQPMDLSETQSQGNEWLFIRNLEQQLSAGVYEAMAEYKLLTEMGNLICFVMIDEFEQQVYTHPKAGNMTLSEYEAIMEEIGEDYGGIEYITDYIMDIQLYWKYVVLESPVYYISYAVSGVAAIDLFTVAENDLEEAFAIYVRLVEEPREEEGFQGNIRHAGLTGPFEETVYRRLYERYVE